MLLGFSRQQAIEGLRFSRSINTCVEYILRRQDDMLVRSANRRTDRERAAIARRLGNTLDDTR